MTRIIALIGARDGVGKTSLGVDLGARLAAYGQRVCLLELVTDATAASVTLGIRPDATLSDKLSGRNTGESLTVRVPPGFDLVVGGDGSWLWHLTHEQLATISDLLRTLGSYDFLLIDAGTGTAQNQFAFSLASPELLVVVTPAAELLSDTYALLKLLYAEQYDGSVSVVVNKAKNHTVGENSYDKFREVARFYLDMPLPLAGLLLDTPDGEPATGSAAGAGHEPAVSADRDNLARRLLANPEAAESLDMGSFCRRLLSAAGASPATGSEVLVKPAFSASPADRDFHQQLDFLSKQVDDLIAEVERLRSDDARQTIPQPAMPDTVAAPANRHCSDVCGGAEIADRSEQVSFEGESFSIYYLYKENGEQQRFACHSIADDLEEPEPQTRSS
ncbi:MAG: nucleotide-binding protein [Thiogranum sp.]